MKIDTRKPLHWLLLLQQGLYTLIAIGVRYLAPCPGKPVVVLYGHQLSGNLKALYEQWQRTHCNQFDMYFLSLDPSYLPVLEAQGVKVLRCNRLRDMLKAGRCRAMITDHGLHAMQPFIHLTDIIFIDVWHGIPFKGFVPDDFRVQHRYNEVWVSSPLLKEIYRDKFGFRPERVFSLGYARVDKLFRHDTPQDDLHGLLGIPTGRRIVLYAPTWQQDDSGRELFPFGESQDAFIQRLGRTCGTQNATLVIRSHLNASINATPVANVVYCSMKDYADAEELLLHANVLLCDWSSIAFDYLALGRPTIFLDVKSPFKNGFSLGPEYRFGAVLGDMDTLEQELTDALQHTETYQATHQQQQNKVREATYAEFQDGRSAEQQLDRLGQMLTR